MLALFASCRKAEIVIVHRKVTSRRLRKSSPRMYGDNLAVFSARLHGARSKKNKQILQTLKAAMSDADRHKIALDPNKAQSTSARAVDRSCLPGIGAWPSGSRRTSKAASRLSRFAKTASPASEKKSNSRLKEKRKPHKERCSYRQPAQGCHAQADHGGGQVISPCWHRG